MKKIASLRVILLVLLLSGCIPGGLQEQSIPTQNNISTPTAQTDAHYSKPLIYGWRLGDDKPVSIEDRSVGILGVQLSPKNTNIYFASPDIAPGLFQNQGLVLQDDNGISYELLKVIPLGRPNGVDVGIMSFAPRLPGAKELILKSVDPKGESSTTGHLLTFFDGPAEEDRLSSTTILRREGGVQIGESVIELNLWLVGGRNPLDGSLPATDQGNSTGATATPAGFSPGKAWAAIPPGVAVDHEFSITVKNRAKADAQPAILSLQMLNNGGVITVLDGAVAVPTPILQATPSGLSTPYP